MITFSEYQKKYAEFDAIQNGLTFDEKLQWCSKHRDDDGSVLVTEADGIFPGSMVIFTKERITAQNRHVRPAGCVTVMGLAYGIKQGSRTLYTVDRDGNLRAPSVFCLPEGVA